jgi:membrane protease YdiL (CAAX protease family)
LSEGGMTKAKQLISILFFCLALRAAFSTLLGLLNELNVTYLIIVSRIAMYFALAISCLIFARSSNWSLKSIFGVVPSIKEMLIAFSLAVSLFGFTLGENSLEVLALSNFDTAWAYRLWKFHVPNPAPEFLSAEVITYLACAAVIAPICEELFFRGLFTRALLIRHSQRSAFMISSIIFTALHFTSFYIISTTIFAICLCVLYKKTKSLWLCVITHGIFNVFAMVFETYFNFHFERSESDLTNVTKWIPELAMLVLSVTSLLLLFLYCNKAYKTGAPNARKVPDLVGQSLPPANPAGTTAN